MEMESRLKDAITDLTRETVAARTLPGPPIALSGLTVGLVGRWRSRRLDLSSPSVDSLTESAAVDHRSPGSPAVRIYHRPDNS